MTRREKAQELVENLPDEIDVTVDEVDEALDTLVNNYQVPLEEAVRSTRNEYMEDYDGEESVTSPSATQDEEYDIAELDVGNDGDWLNIQGTVEREFELSPGLKTWAVQRGVIADNTGTTIFTVPEEAVEEDPDLELEVGKSYELKAVVGDAYDGELSVKVTSNTIAEEIDGTFTPPDSDTHLTGCLVDIQTGSGLIKRCPEEDCSHVVGSGQCDEHGEVEGEFDLRLKTVIDDGTEAHQVFFGKEATEALTDTSLDEAIQIAEDAMDLGAVIEEMEPILLGRYYSISGDNVGEYTLVKSFNRVDKDWADDAEEVLESLDATRAELEVSS